MKNKVFISRDGAPFKEEDTQDIGEFVFKTQNKTTTNLLKKIRQNPKHPIAKYIEWDDRKASEKYRLQQVRNIVNHIMIEVEEIGDKTPMRVFFSVKELGNKEAVYMDYEALTTNEFALKQVTSRAKTELENWLVRYGQYKELAKISTAIKKALQP